LDCPACGRALATGARFCDYCGAFTGEEPVRPAPEAAPRVTDYWVCGTCNAENEAGDSFCGSCGAASPGTGASVSAVPPSRRPGSLPQAARRAGGATPPPGTPPAASTHGSSSGASRRPLWIIVALVIVAAAALALVIALRTSASPTGDGQTAESAQTETIAATPTVTATTTPTPSSNAAAATPGTWPGISSRPATPFWGAFYCASSDKKKAIEAAQVGHGAGWRTLVLWTGDYGTIARSGSELWVICAGPFGSRSAAQHAVDRMDADARELRAVRPDLDIHFGEAYVKQVE
jgi:hypothetical protein